MIDVGITARIRAPTSTASASSPARSGRVIPHNPFRGPRRCGHAWEEPMRTWLTVAEAPSTQV